MQPQQPRPAWWLTVTFCTFWIGLLLHECAHFAARAALIPTGPETSPVPPLRWGLTAGAGPVTTLLIAGASSAVAQRSRSLTAERIAFACCFAATSRVLLVALPNFLSRPNDEYAVAWATGYPQLAIWGVEFAVNAVLVAYAVHGHRTQLTRSVAVAIVSGIVAGWITAFTIGRAVGLPI